MRIAIIGAIALALTIISQFHIPTTHATVNYDWEYDVTNVYNTDFISYSFTSLDSSTVYVWLMYTVDPQTGGLQSAIGFRTFTGGTSTTISFGGPEIGAPAGNHIFYPPNYVGPMAIVDSNGTILGRHYVAQLPSYINSPDSGWFDGSGNTAVNEKQAVDPGRFRGFCRSAVYAPVNSDGWQHTFRPCSVTTTVGGFALLHYQIDPSYTPGTDQKIRFWVIPDVTVALTIDIDDIIDFQVTGTYAGSGAESYSFVILNTSGEPLPFVDNQRAALSFVTDDNPMLAEFEPGVYNYARNDPSFISDGETVWIVTDDPSQQEWSLEAIGNVGESGTQSLIARSSTPEVWDSYSGAQTIEDTDAGFTDTNVYVFATSRTHNYTVSATAVENLTVSWTHEALAINSGLATPAEMAFTVTTAYNILDVPTIEEQITDVLENAGLNTNIGRGLVLSILLFASMLGVAAFNGLRNSVFAYLLVWTGVGSTFILGGFGTGTVSTMYILLTIILWVAAIAMGDGDSSNENI